MVVTITVRDTDCPRSEGYSFVRQPVHYATTTRPHMFTTIADRYLKARFGKGLYQLGSASSVDVLPNGDWRHWISVSRPGFQFSSVRFEYTAPAPS